jgi:hypothetical protein
MKILSYLLIVNLLAGMAAAQMTTLTVNADANV